MKQPYKGALIWALLISIGFGATIGVTSFDSIDAGDSDAAIKAAERRLDTLWLMVADGREVLDSDISALKNTLNDTRNQNIALARFFDSTKYRHDKLTFYWIWEHRSEYADQPWIKYSILTHIVETAAGAAIVVGVVFVCAFPALLLLRFLWYFSLARLREVVLALRGKSILPETSKSS